MNTRPEPTRSAAGADHTDAALLRAVADMRPGWVVLRDCLLGDDDGARRARVRYALLHPHIGIALLDVFPGATTPGAPDRMRRLLDATNFRLAFGDYPPIIYLCVPSRALFYIAPLLAREFGMLPPLAVAKGDAWVAAAQRALLAAEPLMQVSERMANDGQSAPTELHDSGRVEGWPAPRPCLGLRGLGVFWGVVGLTLGSGALFLEYLGAPEGPTAVAHASADPGGSRASPDEAWLTPTLSGTARPSTPGPMLALWPAERMQTQFDAARAGGAATLESGDAAAVGTRPDGDRSARIDAVASVRPPWSQVAAARTEASSVSVAQLERNGGSDDVLSTEATRPLPPPSETGSGALETASGSERPPAGGGAPPASVGTVAGAGTSQALGTTADDETPASVSRSGADAAAAGARGAGPVAPPLPGFGGAAAPAQASVPTAPPTGALEVPAADAHAADPAASAAETASPSATATADAPPRTGPPAIPFTHAEPPPAPVQPVETAVPSTAAAAAGAAQSATKPQPPPPSGASPAVVAALLARGDALIAIGDVAAARLVYQRAAAHASARAATAAAKTYDPRFLRAIGAIGVVADPDAAAAWYRRGSALGDEDATPLLGGLEGKASQ